MGRFCRCASPHRRPQDQSCSPFRRPSIPFRRSLLQEQVHCCRALRRSLRRCRRSWADCAEWRQSPCAKSYKLLALRYAPQCPASGRRRFHVPPGHSRPRTHQSGNGAGCCGLALGRAARIWPISMRVKRMPPSVGARHASLAFSNSAPQYRHPCRRS